MAKALRRDRSLLLVVFFTNLVSLACQVLWVRKFSYLFGSTAAVFSAVLAVFLLGLAVGALVAGRRADVAARPHRFLAIAEVTLGVWCALSLPLFEAGRAAYLAVAPASLAPAGAAGLKFFVVLLCILVPTAAIGAIFPLATRLYGRSSAGFGEDVSVIYALDTLGAALGALLAALFFVTWMGLMASTIALGVLTALLGLWLLRQPEAPAQPAAAPAPPKEKPRKGKAGASELPAEPQPAAPGVVRAVLAVFFLTGAAAVLLETGWNRLFYVLNGTSVYSLAVVLAGFLGGLGAGSWWMRRRVDKIAEPLAAAAGLFALIALGGVVVLRASGLFERLYLTIFEITNAYATFQFAVCLLIFAVVFLPATAMGANFPLIARFCATDPRTRGTAVGKVFFFNTLGAVAGAIAGEFLVLPRWGFGGLAAVTLLIYTVAVVVLLRLGGRLSANRPALACGGLLAAAVLLSPLVLPFHLPRNAAYYHGLRAGNLEAFRSETSHLEPLWERQGFYGHVAVLEYQGYRLLKHNGKTDASDSAGDNFAQLLMSQLPLLFHPAPKQVLNIGLGGGATLRAIVHNPEVEHIAQVEIDPLVAEAARAYFADFNGRALEDPRVDLVINDGRNYIEASPRKFDVIVSEPPNIWVAGVSGLFTREFYRAAKAHLEDGGILSQWLPLHELERDDFRIGLHTVLSVFAHASVWTNGVDAIVLASDRPLTAQPEIVSRRLAQPGVRQDVIDIGLRPEQVLELMGKPNFPDSGMADFLKGIDTLNTDNLPLLEFRTARNLYTFNKQTRRR